MKRKHLPMHDLLANFQEQRFDGTVGLSLADHIPRAQQDSPYALIGTRILKVTIEADL